MREVSAVAEVIDVQEDPDSIKNLDELLFYNAYLILPRRPRTAKQVSIPSECTMTGDVAHHLWASISQHEHEIEYGWRGCWHHPSSTGIHTCTMVSASVGVVID